MKHIQTLNGATLKNSAAHGGCGECQTSCQSACKTSCTVANQKCENDKVLNIPEKGGRQPALFSRLESAANLCKFGGISLWYTHFPRWAGTWRWM